MLQENTHTESWVRANLVLSADGSTTLAGSSRGLSSPEDRRRFHQLRSEAHLIVIGGRTAHIEPYEKTPVPLIVFSRNPLTRHRASENPLAKTINTDPIEFLRERDRNEFPRVVVEGGIHLVRSLLEGQILDGLFLTVTKVTGDPSDMPSKDFIQLITHSGLHQVSYESLDDEDFLFFTR